MRFVTITRLFSVILILLVLANPLLAKSKTEKELSNLTPEESSELGRKMIAKQFHPLPESMFTRLGIAYNYSVFLPTLNTLHEAGMKNVYVIYGTIWDVMYKINDKWNAGISYGTGANKFIKEVSNVEFREDTVLFQFYHFKLNYKIYEERDFVIGLSSGIGTTTGEYGYFQASEDGSTNARSYKRQGSTTSYNLGLEAMYYLNPVWNVGMGIEYFGANIESLSNRANQGDSTAPNMDLSGTLVRFFTKINL
ncbi:MAG: hypothetical protein O3A01_04860 [bacterium]|nr:hypothetical protein [bacterium]